MTLEEILKSLGEDGSLDALAPFWDDSMESLPSATPDFLDANCIREARGYAGMDPSEDAPLAEMAERIRKDGVLKRLAWHCRRVLYEETRYPARNAHSWPKLENALGGEAAYFYAVIALASAGHVRAWHRSRNLPEEITRATCSDAARFRPCRVGEQWVCPGSLYWLRHMAVGDLFQIGRHQYILGPFYGRVLLFRHRSSGNVLALSEPGLRYGADGYCDGDGGVNDPRAWTASLSLDERHACGFPVSPPGRAVQHEVRLRLDEWCLILIRDTPVLRMHIPPGAPVPAGETGESMVQAVRFFGRHLPERAFRALACVSWLFNPQLEEILGEASNLVAWQREEYLYPWPAEQPGGLAFIFGYGPFDPATAPRDTRLRRGVVGLLEQGRPWRSGAMVSLPEDLPHFGSQFYRNRWPAVCKQVGLPDA